MDTPDRKVAVRVAATLLTALLCAGVVVTYLAYTSAFTRTDTVTVEADRAGLVLERDAKVKYLGVPVGRISGIAYHDGHAYMTLAIRHDQMDFIPADATVRIGGNTVFGAKSVEFLEPPNPSNESLAPGSHIAATSVSVEVNTLFQRLVDTLHQIDPIQLNGTVTGLSEGLRDNGDNVGATLGGFNEYLARFNPKLPALQDDLRKASTVARTYADAAPDLVTLFGNLPTIDTSIVDHRDDLNATLAAATGAADHGFETLQPAADDYITAIQRLRAPLKVLSDYSPEFGCLITALGNASKRFGPYLGGYVPGLSLTANFMLGQTAYTYPASLPIVNASGGPNCRGLPDLPSKQFGGSWYHSQFLVTDNAYVPYQPTTELAVDPPSTLQFLFNGAYAERNRY